MSKIRNVLTGSLMTKVTALFLLVGLTATVAIGYLAIARGTTIIRYLVYAELDIFEELKDEELESYFAEREGDATVVATSRDVYQSLNILAGGDHAGETIGNVGDVTDPIWVARANILDDFLPTVADQYGYSFIFVTDSQGRVVYDSGGEIEGADVSGRDYVQGSLGGRVTWSELFFSDLINANALVVSAPVRRNGVSGEIVGSVNLTMDQRYVDAMVHEGLEHLGESADSYLIDADGLLLTNTMLGEFAEDAALKQTISTEAVDVLSAAIREGDLDFNTHHEHLDYLGNPVLGALTVTRLGGDAVGLVVEIDEDEAFAGVAQLQSQIFGIAGILAVLVIILGYLISRAIVRPIITVADQLGEISTGEGDLTRELQVNSNDELGRLGDNFNAFIGTMRALVADVMDSSGQVVSTAGQLESNAKQVSEASEGIARAMEQVAQGATKQSSSVEEANQVVNQLRDAIDQISTGAQDQSVRAQEMLTAVETMVGSIEGVASNATSASEVSERASETAQQGSETIEAMVVRMEEIRGTAVVAADKIGDLGKSSDEIGEITDVITDIARQTNLLALNAAIEAARADQNSRGFAVVADEVRKLAERAGDAASEISSLIGTIQTGTKEAVEAMERGSEEVEAGSREAGEAGRALEEILGVIGDVTARVQEMAETAAVIAESSQKMAESVESVAAVTEENTAATEQMAAGAEQMGESVENVAAVSQDNASAAEEVAASVEELNASMSEVAESSKSLGDIARALEEKVSRFKVS